MHSSLVKIQGITLLEIMLVLAIGASIVLLSVNQYLSFRGGADAVQVRANVDSIFQGMSSYYKINCYGTSYDTSGGTPKLIPGELNPQDSALPATIPINITTDLINNKLLPTPLIPNPIVNAAGSGTNGYSAQFIRKDPADSRTVCTDTACSNKVPVGTIYTWMLQVSVQLQNPATAKQYLGILQGDCLATSATTTCSASGNTGNFVIWERLPMLSNSNATSDYWVTTPTVAQFKQMYTTYPITVLTNGNQTSNQYYLCNN